MGLSVPILKRAWLLIPLLAAAFLLWADLRWAQRVENISNVDTEDRAIDAASPTGYVGGKRWYIVPEHNHNSYQWIAETQQMFARSEWRVRRVDYENAPFGREVHSPSPYRWWLGLVAWIDHVISGRSLGLSVERAALWANPLLQFLLLTSVTVFLARNFGPLAGAWASTSIALLYPLSAAFVPGAPDATALSLFWAAWSVLPLLVATGLGRDAVETNRNSSPVSTHERPQTLRANRCAFLAGLAGGVGLWINVSVQGPLVVGLALGGMLAAVVTRPAATALSEKPAAFWRSWALGGATLCLLGFLIEYYPSGMDLRLQVNHPLYGLAWLALGEIVAQFEAWLRRPRGQKAWGSLIFVLVAIATLAALPVTMAKAQSFPAVDSLASRLSDLPNAPVAANLAKWWVRDGLTGPVIATALALLLLFPVLWICIRKSTSASIRRALALTLAPLLVVFGMACAQLHSWSLLNVVLFVFVAVGAREILSTFKPTARWSTLGVVAAVMLAGLVQLVPPRRIGDAEELTKAEIQGLIERGLAHWISAHAEPSGAVVLAPPETTTSLCFYGGFKGMGTPNWENTEGLASTVQIVTATTAEQAQAIIGYRGVTHLVLPSWDTDLDNFVTWTVKNPDDSFLNALHHWAVLPWLRPLPYQVPSVSGLVAQSVVVFKVTDDTSKADATSRLAEYFLETEQKDLAAIAAQSLQQFPTNLGALVALAQVAKAQGDEATFAKTLTSIIASLNNGLDRTMPLDRRVSLAVVLAIGNHPDLARKQIERCLKDLDESHLRSLTNASVFKVSVLAKTYDVPFPDERLHALAVQLVPPELRSRLK